MQAKDSLAESFLTDFHDARPGLTSNAFGALPVMFRGHAFASSYEVLATVVPHASTQTTVIDLACGDGFLLELLAMRAQPGMRFTGVDMSVAELELARTRLGPTITLLQAKAQDLPIPSGDTDYLLCHLALMLMDDGEHVLREIHRVLRPGGTLAAIVGAAPPPTPAFKTYVEILAKYPRVAQFSELRFGDRRFRNRDGILEILAPAFENISIDEIHIAKRITPEGHWLWLLDMYDLYLLNEADRTAIHHEYLSAAAAHCDREGKLEYLQTLRFLSATAA